MTTETPEVEADDTEIVYEYTPETVCIGEGETVLFDREAFAESTGAVGIFRTGPQHWLIVPDADNFKFVEMGAEKKPKPRGALTSVKP